MPTDEKMLRLKGSTYTCKRSFTIINIFMSVQRVNFPLTPSPLLKVKENDDSVELVIKNTSTLFEILKNSQPRSRTPTSLKNCTVCTLMKMLKIVNGP
jgi:hypothetical protein